MAGLNFFDKMFDFNHDGKSGAFETGAKWATDFPGYVAIEKYYNGAAETTSSIVALI